MPKYLTTLPKTKAKLVSADGLTRYIDIPYPFSRIVRMALRFPLYESAWMSSNAVSSEYIHHAIREYELIDQRNYKNLMVGIYQEINTK